MKTTEIKIERQGSPIVNDDNGIVHHQDNKVAIIEVDMKSKWCQIDYSCNTNSIGIIATDRSRFLDETKDKETYTQICFPEFDKYEIWSMELSRYTLRLCLVKNMVNWGEVK